MFKTRLLSAILLGTALLSQPLFAQDAKKTTAAATVKKEAPKIDVVFVLDTTGSMSGLIEGAKQKIWSITNEILKGQPTPEVRIGLVAYRDKGDAYVTQVTDLSKDIDAIYTTLMGFRADGGGDGPEHVNQALKDAIEKMSWTSNNKALKLVFLVGDAPPHEDYGDNFTHKSLAKQAISKGIQINTIRCGGDPETGRYWEAIALAADGSYISIEQSGGTYAVTTPYDADMAKLGAALDDTALSYGSAVEQSTADKYRKEAAMGVAAAPAELAANRAAAKSKAGGAAYSSDLISDIESGKIKLESVKEDQLPEAMKKMSKEERKKYVEQKLKERKDLKTQIAELDKKRDAYVAAEEAKPVAAGAPAAAPSFDSSVKKSLKKQAADKGIAY